MNTQHLIATVAAVLIASTSGGLFHHSASRQLAEPTEINGSHVVNLAPVNVYAQAADLRAAALLPTRQASTDSSASVAEASSNTSHSVVQYSLVGAQLAMPYYSFSNASGRISKE